MVKNNIVKIKERVALARSKIGKDLSGIKIVAVSKGRGIEDMKEAVTCGITDIAENRVGEAFLKYNDKRFMPAPPLAGPAGSQGTASDKPIKWHMVGHLQTNKVKDAVRIFDLIQSVDSLRLAFEINKEAQKINKVQDVLIEIKTSPEATKFGLKFEEAPKIIKEITKFNNLNIKGLMTIAPPVSNPDDARQYFRLLRELRAKINESWHLSMGMTDDFEVAIEEGADIIRIGRGIFEG